MNETQHSCALIIFIRNPEYGKVKSRLAATMGNAKALKIYKELLRHTREVTIHIDARRHLFYSEDIRSDDEWLSSDYEKQLQASGDLGDKMRQAFETVLQSSKKAIIIGSDCPQITPEHINNAIALLENHDIVIGPSLDGGYYLLGMKSLHIELFDDMTWSTDSVYSETIERITMKGLSYGTTETLSDVDHERDWIKWGWEI